MKQQLFILALFTLTLSACENSEPRDSQEENTTSMSRIDSLLQGKDLASEMELPILWTDAIYDTCFTCKSPDGQFVTFIGYTEEDKIRTNEFIMPYGVLGMDERNSIFLYNVKENTTMLLKTTSPSGGSASSPQIDSKHEYVYYFQQYGADTKSFCRYNLLTHEDVFLLGCDCQTYYQLQPNGNILFHDVRVEVIACELTYDDWIGYVFCDMELSPTGICIHKSDLYTYDDEDSINYDLEYYGFLSDKSLTQEWDDSVNRTQYYDKNGVLVGATFNTMERYNGCW